MLNKSFESSRRKITIFFMNVVVVGHDRIAYTFCRRKYLARNRNASILAIHVDQGKGQELRTPGVKFRSRKPVRPYKIVK